MLAGGVVDKDPMQRGAVRSPVGGLRLCANTNFESLAGMAGASGGWGIVIAAVTAREWWQAAQKQAVWEAAVRARGGGQA